MWGRHHSDVPYGVVDVGSNTVRLLVAAHGKPVLSLRATLGLGACVERSGVITESKLAETADHVARFVAAAREAGAVDVEVLITSPGRQAANGPELLDAIGDRHVGARPHPVRPGGGAACVRRRARHAAPAARPARHRRRRRRRLDPARRRLGPRGHRLERHDRSRIAQAHEPPARGRPSEAGPPRARARRGRRAPRAADATARASGDRRRRQRACTEAPRRRTTG